MAAAERRSSVPVEPIKPRMASASATGDFSGTSKLSKPSGGGLRDAAMDRGHRRQAGSHRFEQGVWDPLPITRHRRLARMQKQVGALVKTQPDCSWEHQPRNSTLASRSSSRLRARISSPSGPSPANSKRAVGTASTTLRIASSVVANPFLGIRRQACKKIQRPSSGGCRKVAAWFAAGIAVRLSRSLERRASHLRQPVQQRLAAREHQLRLREHFGECRRVGGPVNVFAHIHPVKTDDHGSAPAPQHRQVFHRLVPVVDVRELRLVPPEQIDEVVRVVVDRRRGGRGRLRPFRRWPLLEQVFVVKTPDEIATLPLLAAFRA